MFGIFSTVAILFMAFAGWMILSECLGLVRARRSERWPHVEGRVLESEVRSRHRWQRQATHSARVRYEYEVEGQTYDCGRISFCRKIYFGRASAEGVAAQYPVGDTVVVYHDPKKPRLATLETGISVGSFLLIGVSSLFFLAGLWLLFFEL